MRPTWKHTFRIIEIMFNIKVPRIAECLGVNRSTIHRLIDGDTVEFKRFNTNFHGKGSLEEFYELIFDPTNNKSPAYETSQTYDKCSSDKETYLLGEFMGAIEEAAFTDFWEYDHKRDYKSEVMFVLRRTRNPYRIEYQIEAKDVVVVATPIADGVTESSAPDIDLNNLPIGAEAVKLREVFKDALLDHQIDVLLDQRDKIGYDDFSENVYVYFKKMKTVLNDSSASDTFSSEEKCMIADMLIFNKTLEGYIDAITQSIPSDFRAFIGESDKLYHELIFTLEKIWSYRGEDE